MKAVSVINFKGGVGKTTLSLHLACHLAETARVLLIDVDHQSSLSFVILTDGMWKSALSSGKTINTVFESFCNRAVPFPGEEIIIRNPFHQRNRNYNLYPNLDLTSAQFELDDTEIDLASTNYGNAALSDWEKRTLIASWLDKIDASAKYDYVIFDCPPATKIVSQNALSASDGYIIPVIPDEMSSRGVTHFKNLVENKIDSRIKYLRDSSRAKNVPHSYKEDTRVVGISPFLVKTAGAAASGMTNIHTTQLAALRKQWGASVLTTVGKNYIGVPMAIEAGWPVWNYHTGGAHPKASTMMRSICKELKSRIDIL